MQRQLIRYGPLGLGFLALWGLLASVGAYTHSELVGAALALSYWGSVVVLLLLLFRLRLRLSPPRPVRQALGLLIYAMFLVVSGIYTAFGINFWLTGRLK